MCSQIKIIFIAIHFHKIVELVEIEFAKERLGNSEFGVDG